MLRDMLPFVTPRPQIKGDKPMNVLFFKTTSQGAVERTLTHYADNEKALIALFGGMRASINDENIVKVVGEIITDDGNVTKCERFERVVQPVEESEGEEE